MTEICILHAQSTKGEVNGKIKKKNLNNNT